VVIIFFGLPAYFKTSVIAQTLIAFNLYTSVIGTPYRTMNEFILIVITLGSIYAVETDQDTCYSTDNKVESFFELRRDPNTVKLSDGQYQHRFFFNDEVVFSYYCALKFDVPVTSYDDTSTFPNLDQCRRKIRHSICVDRRE
tara:strand:- start:74 stop:499 length:426 start_codon:yes stop_codon:yes gene_type:complete